MLVSMVETMAKARANMYCIPALSAANEITVKAAIAAAEEKNAPLIMLYMFNTGKVDDILSYGYMATRLAEKASVPVSIILDHGSSFDHCMLAMRAGFSDAAASAIGAEGALSRRMPNTFSQATRYSGTSEKVSANAASTMPTSLAMPAVRGSLIGRPSRSA